MVTFDQKYSAGRSPESLSRKFRQLCTSLCTSLNVRYNRGCLTESVTE